jgi:hypothetical protein
LKMPEPCQPDDALAGKILSSCAVNFVANSDDCNKFLKAALADFLPEGYLDNLNADEIVAKMRSAAGGWETSRAIDIAIAKAKAGNVVVAGMTAAALRQHHGHVAVVVGCEGEVVGGTTIPVGYAGSLGNPAARLEGGRLSQTFAASLVRSGGLDYYFRPADRVPA